MIIAKNESDKLNINIREILRIKMIEYTLQSVVFLSFPFTFLFRRNMIGITIHAQKQVEFGRIDSACDYNYDDEEDEIIKQYTEYQLNKNQSDV